MPEMAALTATGPLGAVGALALGGSAVYGGGVAGKAFDEARKDVSGLRQKNDTEAVESINRGGMAALEGEAIGRTLAAPFGWFRRYPRMLGGSNPQTEHMTDELLRRGYQPPVKVAAPEAVGHNYAQTFIDGVTTSVRKAANAQALEKDITDTLGVLGMSRDEAEVEFNKMLRGQVDTRVYGEEIAKKVEQYVTNGEESLTASRKAMSAQIEQDVRKLESSVNAADPKALEMIQGDIESGKAALTEDYRKQYEGIWKLSGGQAIFDTSAIKATVQDLLERLPPTVRKEIKKQYPQSVLEDLPGDMGDADTDLASAGLGGAGKVDRIFVGKNKDMLSDLLNIANIAPEITPQQAHMFRSQLLAIERDSDFMRNFAGYGRGRLTRALDQGFDDLEQKIPGFTKQLREINRGYKNAIEVYNNATVKRIMRDQSLGGKISPEDLSTFVKNPDQFRTIWAVVSPETRQQVAANEFRNMIDAATDVQSGIVDGKKLAKQLKAREDVGPTMFGRRYADALKLADRYAAMDGEIPASALTHSPDMAGSLERIVKVEDDLRKQMLQSGGWMKSIGKDGVIGDRALKLVVEPGQVGESRLLEAEQFFQKQRTGEVDALKKQASDLRAQGRTSEANFASAQAAELTKKPIPEMDMARRYALVKLLSDAAGPDGTTIGEAMLSGDLQKAWNMWTDGQKRVLFGPLRGELDALARRQGAVRKNPVEIGAAMAKGSTLLDFAKLPLRGVAMLMDRLYAQPGVLRWFTGTMGTEPLPGVPLREFMSRPAMPDGGMQPLRKPDYFEDYAKTAGEQEAARSKAQWDRAITQAWRAARAAPGTTAKWIARVQAQADKDYEEGVQP